ncbi:MAG TPA: hypothetical protein DCY64_12350 [Hydrogenophaga sp.]|uniref:hypothetical protein n=1 Tax=Hydrogenophaga sp. TaxID=1904254 RepID=UPI0008CF8B57|nr:hypothetical protein [Hydrogenophaga sp.]OGA79083.1 MAG: hypothetical protein A2X73_14165 [Burkholderiales bacterium GWE1_65_30]OGA91970.1 MAG: hypothetical protein A2X72_15655 [Burkholderiales bacterium GWF1_66_17]HAX21059.1 hypothetical protein [Hydrogenophaga sp.]HBU18966.1 hypothetical protein [Hydrogenophaga sp.]
MLVAFGEDGGQCQGKLFGRPALAQKVAYQAEEDAITVELARCAVLPAALMGAGSCCGAGVACVLSVAPQFSADDAG